MDLQRLKETFKDNLKQDVPLASYTTLKVGGLAQFFLEVRAIEDLIKALIIAREDKIPYLLLGNGSNILVNDSGFSGLVILNRTSNIAILDDKAELLADSGVMLPRLIMQAAEHNLGGLEPLFGIPTTVGGAVYGNAGANRVEISRFIKYITCLNEENKIVRLKTSWLKPGYRTTKLKQLKQEQKYVPIVLTVKLQLLPTKKEEILKKIQMYQNMRVNKQPYDKPTCGSVFKNPGLEAQESAGALIESLGYKGKKIGDAEVSKKHANFIENRGKATAAQIYALVHEIKDKAREEKGIELEEEIEYVGF